MSASTLPPQSPSLPAIPPAPAWKDEVSERLRAHRTRRTRVPDNQPPLPGMENALPASSVAARVAERYARVPSYREMLAAQAAAQAAAEAAAQAAAKAAAEAMARAAAEAAEQALFESASLPSAPPAAPPAAPHCLPASDDRLWQPDLIRYSVSADSLPARRTTPTEARARHQAAAQALPGLLDPLADALVEPTRPLPARLIEFPRELVAPRKARPRLAEGPLRDEELQAEPASHSPLPQNASLPDEDELRIVEADPETRSAQPMKGTGLPSSCVPQWHAINLDAERSVPPTGSASASALFDGLQLHVASLADRAMAAIVDIGLTLAAFLVFVLVFAVCTTHPPSGHVAAAGAALTLIAMWVLYQLVFFGLSDATPGMRYAKIALCTFDDENPSRAATRGRIAALMLSALPLGLGFLWAAFDEDSLAWHDRITQTYQRSYREF